MSISGGLGKQILRRRIRNKQPGIRFCYDNQLRLTPGMGNGQIVARFEIALTGKVTKSQAKAGASSAAWKSVAVCVADVIRTIEFTLVHNGRIVEVHYPYLFHSDNTSGRTSAIQCCNDTPPIGPNLLQLRKILAAQRPGDDFDGDGIQNKDDQCSTKAEIFNGVADGDGCPDGFFQPPLAGSYKHAQNRQNRRSVTPKTEGKR